MKETTYTAEQAAQIEELVRLIYLARTEPDSLAWHQANLLEWLTTWCADHPTLGRYSGDTRLQARALRVFTTVLWGADREINYFESNTPGLYTQEKESREDWEARNRRESAILARNIVLRNVEDYEDHYGING
ncbi:MAG: hypothetical protein ACOX5L_09035 [Bacteroidales bacterium]|jgi:hypothetical protein